MNILNIADNAVLFVNMILYMPVSYFFYKILCCTLPKRDGRVWSILIFGSGIFISSMVIRANDMFNITLDLIWLTALMLVCFKGKIMARLSAVTIIYPLIIAQNFLVSELSRCLWLMSGRALWVNIVTDLMEPVFHLGIWYLICKAFQKHVSPASRLFNDKTWALLGCVCLASLVSITVCLFYAPQETVKIWPCALACMATNIGSIYLAGYFVNSIQMEMEQRNLKLRQDYYEELEKNQAELRKFRHDMNNHFLVMRDLFETGDKETAKEYLKEVEAQITPASRVFCPNSIVNAVLNAKYNLAVSHNIDCFFHIDLPEITAIDPVSLCSIVANTLDNAIEASVKIPDPENRRISVKARIAENGFFSYEVTNAKVNPVRMKKERYLSDKGNHFFHGLGIANLREIVDKYEGMLDISYTENTFSVVILIGNVL